MRKFIDIINEAKEPTKAKKRKMAYNAIERDGLSDDPKIAARGDAALKKFTSHKLTDAEVNDWYHREVEYMGLHEAEEPMMHSGSSDPHKSFSQSVLLKRLITEHPTADLSMGPKPGTLLLGVGGVRILVEVKDVHRAVNEDIEIDDADEMPGEQEAWDRQVRIEKAIKRFCEQEVGLGFGNRSYQINYDADENEVSISPDDEEITLEQLMKMRVMGEVIVACSGSYELNIKIKTPPGFDISES